MLSPKKNRDIFVGHPVYQILNKLKDQTCNKTANNSHENFKIANEILKR